MTLHEQIREAVLKTGFTACGAVPRTSLVFHPEIRALCEGNACRSYHTSWACPPAVGTLDECRARVEQYASVMLISHCYTLEDSFDFEGMRRAMHAFKDDMDALRTALSPITDRFFLLSNEGCGRCAHCTYPDAPCRFPDLLCHSIEGYGFIVSELAAAAGMQYYGGADTVTYFGAVLFSESEKKR